MDVIKNLKVGEQIDIAEGISGVKIEKRHSEKKDVDYTVVILELVNGEQVDVFLRRNEIKLLVITATKATGAVKES